tara:strand:+ start:789 stop:1130 length:342 start_codon:yes stop_codon:yes gene_type:complete
MTTPILLLLGLVLTMLTGLALADAAIKESKRRITDDVPEIEAALQLNAKIRELQGISRVGDELTEKYKTVEHVGRVREQTISRGEIIDVLTATGGLSEGVTADAILAAMRSEK